MALYNIDAARTEDQKNEMKRLDEEGICLFCPDNIYKSENPLEFETKYWMVKKNDYPYKGTKHHVLLIPKVHAASVSELPAEVQTEFLPVVSRCETLYKLGSYAIAMRSGDMHYNGGSIEHLHAHMFSADLDDPDFEPIRVKLSDRPR